MMKDFDLKKELKKWKVQIILIVACAVLALIVIGLIKKVIILDDKLDEMKKQQMSTDAIREELKEVSKYSAYEFNYTSILYFSDNNKIKNIDIPFTNTEYIATIDGKMNIGIKSDLVDFQEKRNSKGEVEQVTIVIPHSTILDNSTDSETLKEYDYDKNVFNPVKPDEYNELRVQAEKKEEEKVEKSDILQKSDERIEHLMKSHFQAVYGNDVEIIIEYLVEEDKK